MTYSLSISKVWPLLVSVSAFIALCSALNGQWHDVSFVWNLAALAILLVLVLTHLVRYYPPQSRFLGQPVFVSYALLLLWALLGQFWSAVPSDSLLFWLELMPAMLAMYLGYLATETHWRFFRALLLPLAVVSAAYTLYQSQWLGVDRPAGFFLDWNSNAVFISLCLLPACAAMLNGKGLVQRHLIGMLVAVCAMGIALTQSRSILLVLAISLIPLVCLHSRQTKVYWPALMLAGYLLLGFIVAEVLQHGAFVQRLGGQAAGGLETMGSGRHALWAAAWQMMLDKPWLGWGLGMYHWLYPQYRPALQVEGGQLAHNDYLEIWLSLGPLGLLLLLAFVGSLVYLALRAWRSGKAELVVLAFGTVAIQVHSLLNDNLFKVAIMTLLGFYVGYITRQLQPEPDKTLPDFPIGKPLYLGAIGLLGVGCCVWFALLATGLQLNERVADTQKPQEKIAYLSQAETLLPYMELFHVRQAAIIVDMLGAGGVQSAKRQDLKPLVRYALNQVEKALQKNPLRALNHKLWADLMAIDAQSAEMQQRVVAAYREALRLDPYDLQVRFTLASYLEQTKQPNEAYQVLLDALDKAYFQYPMLGVQCLEYLKHLAASGLDAKFALLLEPQVQQLVKQNQSRQQLFVLKNPNTVSG